MPANTKHSNAQDEEMPYRYGDDILNFGIEGFHFDGGESGSPDYKDRTLPLYGYGAWDEVTIEGTVDVAGQVDRLFPDDEGPPFPADVVLVVDCEETQTRYKVVVEDTPIERGSYETEFTLQRTLFRGKVTVTPRLVRTERCREGLPFAPNAGMRVGGGESWTILVDEPEKDHNGFPFKYRDFSQPSMPPVELAHSFSQRPNPKLMVNNQHEGIVDVFQSGQGYGFRPNLKRSLKASFGTTLWIQLVFLTATTIAESNEPEFNWQKGVVQEMVDSQMGEYLFGDDGTDYDAVCARLGESVSDPARLREFVTDLCDAVQLYTDYADTLDYFIEEEAP